MTSVLTEVLVDCADAERIAEFWCAVLGWEIVEHDEEDLVIGGPGSSVRILFETVPEPKTIKNRVHLDLHANDGDQAAEVERLIALGATHVDVGQGPDVSFVVLADPEGNEFCVLAGPPPAG